MDYENCLVDLLPPSTKKALQSRFESVDLKAGDLLYEQGDLFPADGGRLDPERDE